jgi:hypothetical protein
MCSSENFFTLYGAFSPLIFFPFSALICIYVFSYVVIATAHTKGITVLPIESISVYGADCYLRERESWKENL